MVIPYVRVEDATAPVHAVVTERLNAFVRESPAGCRATPPPSLCPNLAAYVDVDGDTVLVGTEATADTCYQHAGVEPAYDAVTGFTARQVFRGLGEDDDEAPAPFNCDSLHAIRSRIPKAVLVGIRGESSLAPYRNGHMRWQRERAAQALEFALVGYPICPGILLAGSPYAPPLVGGRFDPDVQIALTSPPVAADLYAVAEAALDAWPEAPRIPPSRAYGGSGAGLYMPFLTGACVDAIWRDRGFDLAYTLTLDPADDFAPARLLLFLYLQLAVLRRDGLLSNLLAESDGA